MPKKKIKVDEAEFLAPDGTPWKEVAIEAHSVAAAAMVSLKEIMDHIDRRSEQTVERYLAVTEQLFPGSMARAEQMITNGDTVIAEAPTPLTAEGEAALNEETT